MTTRSERAEARALTQQAHDLHLAAAEGLLSGWSDPDALDAQIVRTQALASSGIFSRYALAAISGLGYSRIRRFITVPKDATGGTITPDSLSLILELLDQEERRDGGHGVRLGSRELVVEIVERGTRLGMLSKLTAIPVSTLNRWLKEAS